MDVSADIKKEPSNKLVVGEMDIDVSQAPVFGDDRGFLTTPAL